MKSANKPLLGKKTRVTFALECIVNELSNLPYVSGFYYIKWRVYAAGSAGNTAASAATGVSGTRGVTYRATVRDHTGALFDVEPGVMVVWNAHLSTASTTALEPTTSTASPSDTTTSPAGHIEVVISTDKEGTLLPCELVLVIKQELNGGRGAETVGSVTINLSPLVSPHGGAVVPVVKRYLLQEAKVNSTLKVTIALKLIKGLPTDFHVPQPAPGTSNIISIEAIRDMFSADGYRRRTSVQPQQLVEDDEEERKDRTYFGDAGSAAVLTDSLAVLEPMSRVFEEVECPTSTCVS
ncbi:hypothetical protein HDU98_001548 [Podochytrium sp. JEL0797]|nr:hypothetical protein HDU98_001548 [Podochytrium sp. JEL0797]